MNVIAKIRGALSRRPNRKLVALWALNAATLAGCLYEAPVLVAAGATSCLVITASFLHWRYQRIMVPARAVADAFALERGPLGEACRDLAEAIYLHGAPK